MKGASAKAAHEHGRTRRGAGRPTKLDVERRNIRVMAVATELFIEKGFAETTLDDIVKRANVAKRTLYKDFQSKDEIFAAVVRERVASAISPNLELELDRVPLEEALLQLARQVLHICTVKETVELCRLMVAEAHRFPGLISRINIEGVRDLDAAIARAFAQLSERGLLKLVDTAENEARRFCDLVVGMSALHCAMGVRATVPDEAELRARIRLFTRGR